MAPSKPTVQVFFEAPGVEFNSLIFEPDSD